MQHTYLRCSSQIWIFIIILVPWRVALGILNKTPNGKGVAVGMAGTTYISSDYGASWSSLNLATSQRKMAEQPGFGHIIRAMEGD